MRDGRHIKKGEPHHEQLGEIPGLLRQLPELKRNGQHGPRGGAAGCGKQHPRPQLIQPLAKQTIQQGGGPQQGPGERPHPQAKKPEGR